ncbi:MULTISPECIES: hypothetical protein [unclassified Nocardiopsis]|uniref:hypothetical protein n=1 Tax=unclassified Nocardiopsis TaxID=2649073 RepID=UPI001300CEDD|nr:hypothetical protein [Nocardiopsis sp. TSRI0078]
MTRHSDRYDAVTDGGQPRNAPSAHTPKAQTRHDPFSARAEARLCEQITGHRRHGL